LLLNEKKRAQIRQEIWTLVYLDPLPNPLTEKLNFNFARKFENSIFGSCSFLSAAEIRVRVRIGNFRRG
jgi:hypothetical protein